MAIGIRLANLRNWHPQVRSLREHHRRIVLGIAPVLDNQPGQDVNVDLHFWDQQAISPGSNGCLQGGEASIATKQAEQDRLAMRPGGRANTVDKLSCPVDGRLQADSSA